MRIPFFLKRKPPPFENLQSPFRGLDRPIGHYLSLVVQPASVRMKQIKESFDFQQKIVMSHPRLVKIFHVKPLQPDSDWLRRERPAIIESAAQGAPSKGTGPKASGGGAIGRIFSAVSNILTSVLAPAIPTAPGVIHNSGGEPKKPQPS